MASIASDTTMTASTTSSRLRCRSRAGFLLVFLCSSFALGCAYCSEELMKRAVCVPRAKLIALGTCFGKFNRKSAFKLHVTALTYLAPYATVRESRAIFF